MTSQADFHAASPSEWQLANQREAVIRPLAEAESTLLTVGFLPKVKLEIVISDNRVRKAVKAIVEAARTGKIGDGKVFVLGIEECIRIRTAERGEAAI